MNNKRALTCLYIILGGLIGGIIVNQYKSQEVVTQTIIQIDTLTIVKHDTVKTVIQDKVYINRYVPVIQEGIAHFDTTVIVDENAIKAKTHVEIDYNIIDSTFNNFILGFPEVSIPTDSIFITINKNIKEQLKPKMSTYITSMIIGAAIGIVSYTLIQGAK